MRLPVACVAVLTTAFILAASASAADLPVSLNDQEFWRMVTEFSEAGGVFQAEYMSNEDSSQFVIPPLKETTRRGGVYIGVGPEQNFTYVASIQPRIAFVLDIRRDNMIEHLMYKALFELSQDRVVFVSRLFSRKRPQGLNGSSDVKALFDAFAPVETDPRLQDDNLRAVVDQLAVKH